VSLGQIADVVVETMQLQMEEFINGPRQANGWNGLGETVLKPGQIGVVAVAAGDGLAEIFRSLGVSGVVSGGQTNNPSTEEIYRAIEELPAERVIILPNNKNIRLAAEAAGELSPKQVEVVPTLTAPQGFAAMLAFQPDGPLEDTVECMIEAAQQVSTGEITRATRSVTLNGVQVEEGQFIGMVDGRLCSSGAQIDHVLADALAGMNVAEREIVSIYYGAEVSEQEARALGDSIEAAYEDVEVEVLPGGQAHYYYIIGAE
jgi:hypothetical protein